MMSAGDWWMRAVLFAQGVELMVFGMGAVVVFLTVLVAATKLMSVLVIRYFPEPVPLLATRRGRTALANETQTPSNPTQNVSTASAMPTDPHLLAAIAAAVQCHRQRMMAASIPGKN